MLDDAPDVCIELETLLQMKDGGTSRLVYVLGDR